MIFDALVLAAGESHRFGGIKQLADIRGETLLNRTISAYKKAGSSTIYVVLGANVEKIAPTLSADVKIVVVSDWQKGMGYSLSTAVSQIRRTGLFQQSHKLIVGLADQVDIDSQGLTLLMDRAKRQPSKIIAADYNQIQGVPAVFGYEDLEGLCELQGDVGARAYIKKNMNRVVGIEMPSAAFDIDTKEDLYTWQISQKD